jgi:hypothetical protein
MFREGSGVVIYREDIDLVSNTQQLQVLVRFLRGWKDEGGFGDYFMPVIQDALLKISGRRTVPNIFVNGVSIGGCDELVSLERNGTLNEQLFNRVKKNPLDSSSPLLI